MTLYLNQSIHTTAIMSSMIT